MDIHPWGLLLYALRHNYARHKSGKSTLCSTTRQYVPGWAFILGWIGLSSWLLPHYCKRGEWWKRFQR